MAIPPILSNLPILKNFKSDDSSASKPAESSKDAASAQDKVEISAAAQERLSTEDVNQASAAAVGARELLEADQGATLGLDPDFSA